jgi:hypothetical protein
LISTDCCLEGLWYRSNSGGMCRCGWYSRNRWLIAPQLRG